MNTPRAKTALNDFESTARTKNDVAHWYAYVLERQVTVSVRSIIITINRQHSVDGDTWSVGWNKNDGLLSVNILVSRVTLCHDYVDLASWVTGTTGPPFLVLISLEHHKQGKNTYVAIQYPLIPVSDHR